MNWAIKIISKTLTTKISHISWGVTTKAFTVNHTTNNKREDGVGSVLNFMYTYRDCSIKGNQMLLK